MPFESISIQAVSTILAVGVFLLFMGVMIWLVMATSALDLQFAVRLGHPESTRRTGLRWAFLAGGALFVTALVLQGSARLAVETRFLLVFAALALTIVVWHWCGRMIAGFGRRQALELQRIEQRAAAVNRSLSGLLQRDELIEAACISLRRECEVANVMLFLPADGGFRIATVSGQQRGGDGVFIPAGARVVNWMSQGTPVRVLRVGDLWRGEADAGSNGSADAERRTLSEIQCRYLLPLKRDGELRGFFALGRRMEVGPLAPEDQRVAELVASRFTVLLEAAEFHHAQRTAERAALITSTEAEHARRVRDRMAQPEPISAPGTDLACAGWTSPDVTGDYCDVVPLPGGGVSFTIADVSGAGFTACLDALAVQTEIRGLVSRLGGKPSLLAAELDRRVRRYSSRPVAAVLAHFHPAERTLRYCNAGHFAPILLRRADDGAQVMRLTTGGPAMGLLEQARFEEAEVELRAGDLLVAASLGVVQARNAEGAEWNENKLIDTLLAWDGQRSSDIAQLVLRTVGGFATSTESGKDRTLLVLRVSGE